MEEATTRKLPDIFAIQAPEFLGKVPARLLENHEYHASPGVSKSTLDLVHKSIDHWLNKAWDESRSLKFGTACHAAVLEPLTFNDRVKYTKASPRSNDFKHEEIRCAAQNIILLTKEDYDQVLAAADRVFKHPAARELIPLNGEAESSFFVEDERTGILRKCRADMIIPDERAIIDLKTTRSADPDSFSASCTKYRYDVAHAWYVDTIAAFFHDNPDKWTFKMIAVENTPPFNVAVYSIHKDDVAAAREVYYDDIETLVAYYTSQIAYTGYPETEEERVIRIKRRNGYADI